VEFLVYSRDAPGAEVLRGDAGLLEEHWSYTDGFADAMIARGQTLASDGETATGSLHVLGLPSVAAATEFVEQEPNNRAGVYAEHGLWVFENLLGRTMWDFTGDAREPRFLVIAHTGHDQTRPPPPRRVPLVALGAELRERLIVFGTLSEPASGDAVGVALALQAPDRDTAVTLLREGGSRLDAFPRIEVHDWEFGGRR
jgi:uncharacterized protein YciI